MRYFQLFIMLFLVSCSNPKLIDVKKNGFTENIINRNTGTDTEQCTRVKNLKRTNDKIYYLNKSYHSFCVDNDLNDYITDAIKIVKSGINLSFKNGKEITDGNNNDAHRDALQLVPKHSLAMGKITDITIMNATIVSPNSSLQGIFASDGIFERIKIINANISTGSSHGITINGLLSGEIRNSILGKNAIIRLNPLRLGGGKFIWIVQEKKYSYQPIKELDISDEQHVRDYRLAFTKGHEKITQRFWEQNVKGPNNHPASTIVYKRFPIDLFSTLVKSSEKYANAKSGAEKAEVVAELTLEACRITRSCVKLADRDRIYKKY